jgi:hypothetical protein
MDLREIPTTPNTVVQSLPANAMRLSEIFSVKDGDAVTEADREVFDQTYPGWVTEAAGIPKNFIRHVRNPTRYFLYPRPQAGVVLIGEYAPHPLRTRSMLTVDFCQMRSCLLS